MNPNLSALKNLRSTTYTYGYHARISGIAYGLIRGRTMAQMESPNSNPHLFPSDKAILDLVRNAHRPAEPGVSEEQHKANVDAFLQTKADELRSWRKQLLLNWPLLERARYEKNTAAYARRLQVA